MKRYLRGLRNRLLPKSLLELLRGFQMETLLELLKGVRTEPIQWDEAAIQLARLWEIRQAGYPQYLYGLLCALRTAKAIGEEKVTAIEFGVAGGNGLVALEKHAELIEKEFTISIDVVGFDTTSGLPKRSDPRDCPFAFQGGEFSMDVEKVKSRLNRASLRIGDVKNTVRTFMDEDFAPIGFVSIDLDLYTSTRDSLDLFRLNACRMLPRVSMYFDDLIGYPYTTVGAEWAAIKEFNTISKDRQIGQIYGLKHCLGSKFRFDAWPDMFFVLHVYDHDSYNQSEVIALPNLSLR